MKDGKIIYQERRSELLTQRPARAAVRRGKMRRCEHAVVRFSGCAGGDMLP
jgi:hypothetical protein